MSILRFACLICAVIALVIPAMAQDTHNTVPDPTSANFITDLPTFLTDEDADRLADQQLEGFVVDDGTSPGTCLGTTSASMVMAAFACQAYTRSGFYLNQPSASIDLSVTGCAADDSGYIIATKDTTTAPGGNFQRVTGTRYAVDCVSTTQPTIPNDGVLLMQVTTASSAITVVTDLRRVGFNPPVRDIILASNYGFLPGNTAAANAIALQAAATAQTNATVSGQPVGGGFRGSSPTLVIQQAGIYQIDTCITFNAYANIVSDARVILQQTDAQECIFEFPGGFMVYIRGLKFEGGSRAIIFRNNNSNSTMFTCDLCEFQNVDDYAIYTLGTTGVTSPTNSTTLTAEADAGDTTITVASIAGFADKDEIVITNDQGHYHWSLISGAPSGSTITLLYPIPGYWTGTHVASIGADVDEGDFHMSCIARLTGGKLIANRRQIHNVCDAFYVEDSWIQTDDGRLDSNMPAFMNRGQFLWRGMFGVPQRAAQTGLRWVDNHGFLAVTQSRFGGEDVGMATVWNYRAPSQVYPFVNGGSVVIRDSTLAIGPIGGEGERAMIHNVTEATQHIIIRGNILVAGDANDIVTQASAITWSTYFAGLNANTAFTVDISHNMINGDLWQGTFIPDEYVKWQAPRRSPMVLGNHLGQAIPSNRANTVTLYGDDLNGAGTTGLRIQDEQDVQYAFGAKGQGTFYAQTSTSGTDSIVDTGLTLDNIGLSAMYQLMVTGNPNTAGSGSYRDVIYGIVHIHTGDSTGLVSQILFTSLADPDTIGITDLGVSVFFWDGAAQSATATTLDSNEQIRIRVTGYVGTVGANQTVRLQRLQ